MKKLSVKTRIAVWLTLLMVLLAGLLLIFMLLISRSVLYQTAVEGLESTARSGFDKIHLENGSLVLDAGFTFSQNGVSTLIYSRSGALLAGQIPVSFTTTEPFENGLIRTVTSGEEQWLLLDVFLPSGWEDGVWIRAVMEAPESGRTTRNLLIVALIALPFFLILAAWGSYRIARRAFRPLDSIMATAAAINEGKDLSGRIGLPPGRDEFSRLAETFDEMFARLEQSFEAEKRFIADASHELRTPVSVIKGACEYAERYDETEEERQETIAMIHRQAVRMSELIAELLNMTRLEQGTASLQLETLDLGEVVRRACDEQGYPEDRLRLELPAGITLQGDAALLMRLVQNLIGNAFKYGKPEGHVWVSAARRAGETTLTVRDDGIGIPPEEQEKVWERFYQVDASRRSAGAGLGLAMVAQIARLHGGFMTLESIPEVGSAFTFHLPDPPAEAGH